MSTSKTGEHFRVGLPSEFVNGSLALIMDYFYTTHGMRITKPQAARTAMYHFSCALPRIPVVDIHKLMPFGIDKMLTIDEGMLCIYMPVSVYQEFSNYSKKHNLEMQALAALAIIYVAKSFVECTDKTSQINKLIKNRNSKK